jgi:hypothetical protein
VIQSLSTLLCTAGSFFFGVEEVGFHDVCEQPELVGIDRVYAIATIAIGQCLGGQCEKSENPCVLHFDGELWSVGVRAGVDQSACESTILIWDAMSKRKDVAESVLVGVVLNRW